MQTMIGQRDAQMPRHARSLFDLCSRPGAPARLADAASPALGYGSAYRTHRKGRIAMVSVRDDTHVTPLQALSDSIASVVETIATSTVALRGRGRHALGCGVVWRAGILVTAAHVFGRAPATVSAVTSQQASADLTLVGADPPTDLAVFRLPDSGLPAVGASNSAEGRPGPLAIVVGRSL